MAAALWDLGFDILGLHKSLIASACALMALALLVYIFFRIFLLSFLAKHMFLRNLGPAPFRGLYLCDQCSSMLFLCHLGDWLYVVWFLDLAISAPKPMAPKVLRTRRSFLFSD